MCVDNINVVMQVDRPRAMITGVGVYYPDYILNNEELSRMVDTSDEWIMTRVGIKERRILKDPTKGSAWMGQGQWSASWKRRGRNRKKWIC